MRTIFTTRSPLDLSLAIKVNGVIRKVKFVSSAIYGTKCESLFSADEELAEAMMKHPLFGVYYYVKEMPKSVVEASKEEKPKTIEEELNDSASAIIVESVTTKAMAIAYIQGMYGESFTATSVEEMKREAAKKWNTLFPKWGK
jgi:hypothetical protein